ncbi:hypothetical protein CEUSTIGMA_g9834.t1 [Chlamydomonas eustigma]|uniref:HTH HARE-type domain-containing protein n=1 Tax=Chlamydomonas eustigma TaxID=1157962 RepID=A0A250XHB2_9CHLO|nr:hypothetical protein CEUSTIGMA_g9834.t1 [Chlamydomonas eustigma]|eukprot:GAX82406.1 hypothetical protein CEUSTIGMA_g9834.t1 [Chlamydomonas eustigma]
MRGLGRKSKRSVPTRGGRSGDRPEQDEKRTCLGGGIKPLSGGGGIFKSAAVAVLRLERKLMTTGEITKVALEKGHIKCQGKTPEATMASALYTDVKRKHAKSVFTRPQEGLFGLREWIEEGFFPEGWVGPMDGLGLAPFKKRNSSKTPRQGTPTGRSSRGRTSSSASWREPTSSDLEDGAAGGDDDEDPEETEDELETEEETEEEDLQDSPARSVRSAGSRGTAAGTGGGTRGRSRTAGATSSLARGSGVGAAKQHAAVPTQINRQQHLPEEAVELIDTESVPQHTESVPQHTESVPQHRVEHSGALAMQLSNSAPTGMQLPSHDDGSAVVSGVTPMLLTVDDHGALESPLDLLSDVARAVSGQGDDDEFGGSGKRVSTAGSSRRKRRPSGLLIEGFGGESSGPRSPFDDSLAALHEIATSPLSYALLESAPLISQGKYQQHGQHGQHGQHRSEVNHKLGSGLTAYQQQQQNHSSLLMQSGMGSPYLNAQDGGNSMLLQSGASSGRDAMMGMFGMSSPNLFDSLTPGLFNLPIPDSLPSSTPDMINAALQHAGLGSLISPGPSSYGSRRMDGMFSTQLPPPPSLVLQPRNGSSLGASVISQGQPSTSSDDPVHAQLMDIGKVRAVVERLEARMGRNNPQVGKAWVSLARMYQHVGDSCKESMDAAAEALSRALAVCRQFSNGLNAAVPSTCEESFTYLMQRVKKLEVRQGSDMEKASLKQEASADISFSVSKSTVAHSNTPLRTLDLHAA